MGWKLALEARNLGLSGALSDRARLALDHLCWTARDHPNATQAAAEYFEGSVALGAYLLGLDATDEGKRKAADRALRELVDAGLIEPLNVRGGHRNLRWRILVGDRWAPAEGCG